MKFSLLPAVGCFLLALAACSPQPDQSENPTGEATMQARDTFEVLQNESASLKIAIYGGAFTDFHLKNQGLNPLTWKLQPEQMPPNNQGGAPFRGHFLCLGRWGAPSEGEVTAGIPHNGEPTNSWWQVTAHPGNLSLTMEADAPLDGLHIVREIMLQEEAPIFHVRETVKNTASLGRMSNIVQHPTIAPPFLSSETLINSNAGAGLMQKTSYPNPHEAEYRWPEGISSTDQSPIDLRASNTPENYVTTHIFDDSVSVGWITATNLEAGLVYGFVWETEEYPWLNVWHQMNDNGQPVAKGLEFGTTGIGRPYEELVATDTRFHGRNSFEYLDAGETVVKTYSCFLAEVPADFGQVENVEIALGTIRIIGNGMVEMPYLPR